MTISFRTIIFGTAVSLSAITQAHALNTRTWVSSTGSDTSGCGPIQTPCRTLQYAHDQTNAGGEIDVKDSAGYGSVTITKAISIVGEGSIAGVLSSSSGQNAITINAGASDVVELRGLTIEGAHAGYNGVVFNSGRKLDIANCILKNFVNAGVNLSPSSGSSATFILTNTTVAQNGGDGIQYVPTVSIAAKIIIDHVIATGNASGLYISDAISSVRNSIASANNNYGFYFTGGQADVDLSQADENAFAGYSANVGAVLRIGRSTGANNQGYGLYNFSGTINSFGDNRLEGNGTSATYGTIGKATLY